MASCVEYMHWQNKTNTIELRFESIVVIIISSDIVKMLTTAASGILALYMVSMSLFSSISFQSIVFFSL